MKFICTESKVVSDINKYFEVTLTKQQTDFIKMAANRLAKSFLKPLLELTTEKNYPAHIGGLAEILDWSREFYDKYYDKITNEEMFSCTIDNIYNAPAS